MNKILLNNDIVTLDNKINDAEINVKKDSTLYIINPKHKLDLNIKIESNSKLNVLLFSNIGPLEVKLNIESNDNSVFNFSNSFIADEIYNLDINTNLYGNNISNNVNIRGINEENGTIVINMNGTVAGETKDNVLSEYAKIINKSSESNVLIPNLIANTNDVIANHGVSIGGFNNDELFYLTSKGIDEENAKKLIEEGFILSILDEEMVGIVKNILIGR